MANVNDLVRRALRATWQETEDVRRAARVGSTLLEPRTVRRHLAMLEERGIVESQAPESRQGAYRWRLRQDA